MTNNPYATTGIGKIDAPHPPKNEPRAAVIQGNNDLRAGRSQKAK